MSFGGFPTTDKSFVWDTQNDTAWGVVATDGTHYPTIVLLQAAGKKQFPNNDPGGFTELLTLRSVAGTTDGSGFFYMVNLIAAPDTLTPALPGEFVSGSGQTITTRGQVYNLWIKKTVGTDTIQISAQG